MSNSVDMVSYGWINRLSYIPPRSSVSCDFLTRNRLAKKSNRRSKPQVRIGKASASMHNEMPKLRGLRSKNEKMGLSALKY